MDLSQLGVKKTKPISKDLHHWFNRGIYEKILDKHVDRMGYKDAHTHEVYRTYSQGDVFLQECFYMVQVCDCFRSAVHYK
jgi:hypothetical protein